MENLNQAQTKNREILRKNTFLEEIEMIDEPISTILENTSPEILKKKIALLFSLVPITDKQLESGNTKELEKKLKGKLTRLIGKIPKILILDDNLLTKLGSSMFYDLDREFVNDLIANNGNIHLAQTNLKRRLDTQDTYAEMGKKYDHNTYPRP